jgi:uncharacterized protein (DUF1501 family)
MNPKDYPNLQTRRDFFRQAACAAVGSISISTMLRDLRFINTAVAQGPLTDYKALVCIFFGGGNDSNNLVIPTLQDEYANYAATRQNLTLNEANWNPHPTNPNGNVIPISSLNPDGHTYGLHPSCPELATLFGEGKLAMMLNVGPLTYPLTRAQYNNGPKPPQLFSHSDQVTHWQTSLPDQPPNTGWGGRIADLIHPLQYQLVGGVPTASSAKIALCSSVGGTNTFEVGHNYAQYRVSSTSGAVTVAGLSANHLQAMKDVLAISSADLANLQRSAYSGVVENAILVGQTLNSAISASGAGGFFTVPFPTTSLGNQMKMIARLIHGRTALNMKRQIFFATVGGYDTHTAQIGNGANPADTAVGAHANLLNEVSKSLFAFQRAMEQIGTSNSVTSFTASDFSRTFRTNGQGSDHAWGSHHMIMGGAVRGRRTYGILPVLQVAGPDAVPTSNEGRWIPTTAVDQYSSTLAKWFGVSAGDIGTVFPNIGRFATPDLGFML